MTENDTAPEQAPEGPTRAGFVALIGEPNAGKSTLLNRMVGAKVSIVSRKVQTTRALVRGIVMHDTAQIILVDTPGIFAPKRRLDRAMVSAAISMSNTSMPANFLNSTALPSMTGFEASGPILPRPSTAVPLETTATRLARAVSDAASAGLLAISVQAAATPGE